MEEFVVGEVVALPFPFSDLSRNKRRPALVLAVVDNNDIVFCQITSKDRSSTGAIRLASNNFLKGGLKVPSYIRPDKIFTGDKSIVSKRIGLINDKTKQQTLSAVRQLFR